ncbi:MAG: VOC family protein, partial [Parvularculaceae bacterium]|nr:VOC family protein [Parvularculaceae bacterium]
RLKMAGALAENLTQAVPFLHVRDMAASLRFYREGLGFALKNSWTPDAPDKIRWCWLEAGGAALMLEEFTGSHAPKGDLGAGVTVCFMCKDALAIYRDAVAKGLAPKRPFVGNGLWVVSFRDPDGYKIDFESPTDVQEEAEYDPRAHD